MLHSRFEAAFPWLVSLHGPMKRAHLTMASLRSPLLWASATGAVIATALTTGCGGAPPPPPKTATIATPPPEAHTPQSVPPTASTIVISDEIRNRCGISERDAYFAFDSTRVTSQDQSALDGVAHCFVSGPLKGRHLTLIGHADPRGEAEYNITLGLSRADAVEQYLVARGIAPAMAKTTSRGAIDAAGTDEVGWQKDRRVDVTLGD